MCGSGSKTVPASSRADRWRIARVLGRAGAAWTGGGCCNAACRGRTLGRFMGELGTPYLHLSFRPLRTH